MKIACLGLGLVVLLPAMVLGFGQNKVQYRGFDWEILRTTHFDVYYYDEEDLLARRVALLAEASYDSISAYFGHELSVRVPIIVYKSANEFQQTNVTLELLGEGVGGFTELYKNRVVIPFSGSYEDLRHVVMHELTHVVNFDMLYGGLLQSIFTRQYVFAIPLWVLEGLAEYISEYWDAEAEMVMRDAAINGYYFALYQDVQGYLAYKQGQSVIRYIAEKYGEAKLTDILQNISVTRSIDKALLSSLGVDTQGLTEAWVEHVKKQYWPDVATKQDPEDIGFRLTDHRKDDSFVNTMPSISPDGQKIAFLSDRSGYDDIYVMSALDGKVIRRLVKGERTQDFESFHSLNSSISWSPDGKVLALVSKRKDRDVINLVDAAKGKRLRRIDLDFDSVYRPTFSPDGRLLGFVGTQDGRPGLFTYDLETGAVEALHTDALEYLDFAWSPSGDRIAFSAIAPGYVDSLLVFSKVDPKHTLGRDIFLLDVNDGMTTQITMCPSEDLSPVWSPDGTKLMFASDRNGGHNLCLYDFADSTTALLTDVLGGIFSPTWSSESNRLAFSAFYAGGWDVFQVKEPLETLVPIKVLKEREWDWEAPWVLKTVEKGPDVAGGSAPALETTGALAGGPTAAGDSTATPESLVGAVDTTEAPAAPSVEVGEGAKTGMGSPEAASESAHVPAGSRAAVADSTVAGGGTFEKAKYRLRFTPDWIAGSFQYNSAFGLGGLTRLSVSDILGNHRIYVAADIYSSIDEIDFVASYYYLPRRVDYGAGVFHFKNYYYSDRTSMGAPIGSGNEDQLFSERMFGGVAAVSIPLDRFRRFDLDFTAMRIEREIFKEDYLIIGEEPPVEERTTEDIFLPRISYVKDNTIWGSTGPVGGTRYMLSLERSIVDVLRSDLSFTTGMIDFRKYFRFSRRTQFASRFLMASSQGDQPSWFYLGGGYTLRGYEDFAFGGNNVVLANLELRYPFIERLVMRGPLPLTLMDVRGVLFFDIGGAWEGDLDALRVAHVVDDKEELDDLNAGYGFGIRMWFSYFLMKLDFAWATRFNGVTDNRVHFTLGGEF